MRVLRIHRGNRTAQDTDPLLFSETHCMSADAPVTPSAGLSGSDGTAKQRIVDLLSGRWCGAGPHDSGLPILLMIPDGDVGPVNVDTPYGRIERFSVVAYHAFRSGERVVIEVTPTLVAAERTDETSWGCPKCTRTNWGPVCDVCDEPREPCTWTCQACTLTNANSLTVCDVCNNPRHRPEVSGGGGDKLALRCVECGMEVSVSLELALDLRPHPCPNCRAVDPAYAVVAPMVATRGLTDAPVMRFELNFSTAGTTLCGTVDMGGVAQVHLGGCRKFSFPVSFDRSSVPCSKSELEAMAAQDLDRKLVRIRETDASASRLRTEVEAEASQD